MTIKYQPTIEEQRIILQANTAFLGRYSLSIVVGFGSIWWMLKRQKVPLRSKLGFGSLFVGGLTSELIGRKWGVYKAKEVLERLDSESMLRKIMKGEYAITGSKINQETKEYWIELSGNNYSEPQMIEFKDEFDNKVQENVVKTNKYGDVIE